MKSRTLLLPALALALAFGLARPAAAQLVIGATEGIGYYINVNTHAATQIFSGMPVYGLAADDAGGKLYMTDNTTLGSWDYGSPNAPVVLGTITDGSGTAVRVDGLAWANGALYGAIQFPGGTVVEGIYEIDLTTHELLQPPTFVFPHTALTIGAMDYNPNDGLFYVLNDSAIVGYNWGLYSIDAFGSGAMTHVTPSPPFYTDIDGLGVGDDRVYMIRDIANSALNSDIAVYNLITGVFDPSIPTPLLTTSIGSGGCWAPSMFPPTPIGTNYCTPAVPNTSGAPGVITATGSNVAAAGDLTLTATQLPVAQFGYFLASETQGFFQPPGSNGFICLGGTIARYNQPGNVIVGPTGSIPVDLGAIPVNPPAAVVAGDTWNFQCWYRDIGPSNNFTDAVSVTFQ